MARSGPTPEPAKPYAPWLLTPRVREKEMSRVELFERIRREYRDEGVSIRGLAERHRVHRRTVREAVRSAVPAPRKTPVRAASALGGHEATVRRWLTEDLSAPRKQRHTARRVWQRLRGEHGAEVAESTVRAFVAALPAAAGCGAGPGCCSPTAGSARRRPACWSPSPTIWPSGPAGCTAR